MICASVYSPKLLNRLTTTGLTEGITQVNQHSKRQTKENVEVEVFEDDEEVNLLDTQESSHAFDWN